MRAIWASLPLVFLAAVCFAMLYPDLYELPFKITLLSEIQRIFVAKLIFLLTSVGLFTVFITYFLTKKHHQRLSTALSHMATNKPFNQADLQDFKALEAIDTYLKTFIQTQSTLQKTLNQNNDDIEKARLFSEGLNLETGNQRSYLEKIALTLQAMTLSTDSIVAAVNEQNEIVKKTQNIFVEFNQGIQDLFSNIGLVNEKFESTLVLAQRGGDIVKRSVESLNNINKSAKEIDVISQIINDISDRTNLLSLNATIEAARAGKHGSGFAVVADEISKLADQSSQSVQKITDLIEKNIKFSTAGQSLASEARAGFQAIQDSIGEMNETLQATNELIAAEKAQINNLMSQISNIENESRDIQTAIERHALESQNILDSVQVITETTNSITVGIKTIFEMLSDMQADQPSS